MANSPLDIPRRQRRSQPPTVSAVVVNHHGPDLLPRCLAALARQGLAGLSVTVVDNACAEQAAFHARAIFPGVFVLRNPKNMGFCRAANQGLRLVSQAQPDYVLLLNNDVFLEPGCLARLLDFMERTPAAGACQPLLVYDAAPGVIQSAGCGLGLTGRGFDLRQGHDASALPHAPQTVLGASGAAMLLRSRALEKTGDFWEPFVMYFEDLDLSLRLCEAGYTCHCLPAAQARHVSRGSTRPLPVWRRIYRCEQNAMLVAARNFPLRLAALASLLGPLSSLGGCLARLARGKPLEALAYPAGSLAGLLRGLPVLLRRSAMPARQCGFVKHMEKRTVFPGPASNS